MAKKRIRMITDIAMTVLLPMLMAYSLIGEKLHEVIGTLMLMLFILHHVLNRKWHGSVFRGKYNARRYFQTGLDLLLVVFMIAQPLSGILMSKHLYTFIQVPGVSAAARESHLCLAYWGYVLLCIHAGTHLTAPLRKLREKKTAFYATVTAGAAVSIYGAFAFVKRQFPGYMFRRSLFAFFDYSEPRIQFFLDYLAIMILFMAAGCLVAAGLACLDRKKMKKDGETN